jgi:hypothetical protein
MSRVVAMAVGEAGLPDRHCSTNSALMSAISTWSRITTDLNRFLGLRPIAMSMNVTLHFSFARGVCEIYFYFPGLTFLDSMLHYLDMAIKWKSHVIGYVVLLVVVLVELARSLFFL